MNEEKESIMLAVANIRKEIPFGPSGDETKIGVKKFKGGAKVYIIDWYPGMCESIVVIGMHRHSKKFIKCVVKAKHVENLRVKAVYSDKVIEIAKDHLGIIADVNTRQFAIRVVEVLPSWWDMK